MELLESRLNVMATASGRYSATCRFSYTPGELKQTKRSGRDFLAPPELFRCFKGIKPKLYYFTKQKRKPDPHCLKLAGLLVLVLEEAVLLVEPWSLCMLSKYSTVSCATRP